MRHVVHITLVSLVLLAVLLLIPLALNEPSTRRVIGPGLDEQTFEEVTFSNGVLRLAGLLFVPDGEGPFPAAVFIHGSGTSRRDNPWYLSIAHALQKSGIAVLLPDKRGSEHSKGNWLDTSLPELATDSVAAFRFLESEPRIDPGKRGFIGLSQGGWIAPVAAVQAPDAAFVVSISGATVTPEQQLMYEEVNNIVEMGTYRVVARIIALYTSARIRRRDTWRAFAGFDPLPYWDQVASPVFVAFGGDDRNVPVEDSIARLGERVSRMKLAVYPGGGHGITDPVTGHVQRVFLDDLVAFIRQSTN